MRATDPESYESDLSPTSTRVADRSRVVETVSLGPRVTGSIRWVDPPPTPRVASRTDSLSKRAGHGEDDGPKKDFNGRFKVSRAKEGDTASVDVRLQPRRNERAFRGGIEEEEDANGSLLLKTGARHSVSMTLFDSYDGDAAATTAEKPQEQGKCGTGVSDSEVPRLSVDDSQRFDGMGQISGSENAVCSSKARKISDASALVSPSQAGERASAETARWLQWNSGFLKSSRVGTTAQDQGEPPVCLDKVVEEGRGSGELLRCALNSKDRATAAVDAAVIPPSFASTTDGCEMFEPLRVGAMSPPDHADTLVGASTPVKDSVWSSYGNTAACNVHNGGRQPRLSPVEELSFVDSPLTKTESSTRHPGAVCGEEAEDARANAEPLADSVTSRNLHQLPSAETVARDSSKRSSARKAGVDGVAQLPLAGVTTFDNDATTHSVCMRLALSSDPFARSSNSDLLPVAHLDDVNLSGLVL